MKLKVDLKQLDETQTELTFVVSNLELGAVEIDKICFSLVDATAHKVIVNGEIGLQKGSYIEILPLSLLRLSGGDVWQFCLIVDAVFNQYTDMPAGVFIVSDGEIVDVEYTKADKIAARGIDDVVLAEQVLGDVKSRELNCFPLPRDVKVFDEFVDLSGGFEVLADDMFAQSFGNAMDVENDFNVADKLFAQSPDGMALRIKFADDVVNEGYRLCILVDGVEIYACDGAGVHNALMSLWQIAALEPSHVACVEISDAPRFEWRGQHLDVARQFYSVDEVKRFINLMGLYKLNKFHWHLVDDEAWRIEVLALPQLTERIANQGYSEFVEPLFGSGGQKSGGFYSQQDMRDVVAYAAKRNIEVIPEIDIPGHCYALIKCLPELAERGDGSEYKSVQNYENNCLNPALPQTYEFIETVFAEISEIFTSDFIHIGADERPHGSWEKSPKIAELMGENGFNSTEQVQTYFLNKVQEIAGKFGKKTGAWEEATEQGDIGKDGYVVSWKGVEAGIDAAERGYNVVMSPAQYCYFDIAQSADFDEAGLTWTGGRVSMRETYNYEPIPQDTSAEVAAKFKGIQACLWSENLYDKSILDHLMFPRMIALSEICWVARDGKDFAGFKQDLKTWHRPMLDKLKIDYRQRDFI